MTLRDGFRMNLMKAICTKMKSDILPLEVINSLLRDKSEDARKSLLKRACQNGDLIRLKKGLYLMGKEHRRQSYNSFSIANYINYPSYISLESALSYYGLIPEAVYTTTSVTIKKNLEHRTSIGAFSFSHLKRSYFNFGFYQVKGEQYSFLIATPLKALMDYIIISKKCYKSIDELQGDLRFDWNEFIGFKEFVNKDSIDDMRSKLKSHRLQRILREMSKKL